MKSHVLAGAIAGLVTLGSAASASAAPVTVDLRVEGPTRTLVEQKVTVDVRTFKFSDSATTYECNGTSSSGGSATTPGPTRGGVITQASIDSGFDLLGSFNQTFHSPSFTRVAGEDIPPYSVESKYLVEYKNGEGSMTGACGDQVATGDDVVFAYGAGDERVLRLAGPATVKPGQSATLTVTDEGTSAPVASASVAGTTTGADGKATTASLTQRGPNTFKASKSGAIRSNAFTVCVTDGADGFCGTSVPGAPPSTTTSTSTSTTPAAPVAAPDTIAAFAKIGTVTEGKRFAKGKGPRTLGGTVDPEPAGIKDVRLRLSRTDGGKCTRFDGTKERFVTTRKCGVKNARTFSVGSDATFSYLLPSSLPRGRYVLDVIVQDRAGHQTATYQRGRNRVVFFVG